MRTIIDTDSYHNNEIYWERERKKAYDMDRCSFVEKTGQRLYIIWKQNLQFVLTGVHNRGRGLFMKITPMTLHLTFLQTGTNIISHFNLVKSTKFDLSSSSSLFEFDLKTSITAPFSAWSEEHLKWVLWRMHSITVSYIWYIWNALYIKASITDTFFKLKYLFLYDQFQNVKSAISLCGFDVSTI